MSVLPILPPDATKCIAQAGTCSRMAHCARCQVRTDGRPVADYTLSPYWAAEDCIGFAPLVPLTARDTRRTHPPIGSR